MEMLEIFNNKWYLDLDRLVSFFTDLKASEKEKTSIITNRYGSDEEYRLKQDMSITSKEMVESKSNYNTTIQSAKFELIKVFLDVLFGTYYDSDGSPVSTLDPNELPLQQRFAFNTLVKAGILCKLQ